MVKEGYKEIRIGPKNKSIPEEWKVNKLKKIIKKRKGKRPNKLYETNNRENFIPYLSVNYLRGNDSPKWCLKDDDNKVEVKENEILMIWDGSYSGNVFMGFNGALSSTMARLKCENEINNEYLFYQLRNNFKIFQSTTIGTSVPHVAGKIFENLNIPTPEKKEQKKIASILSSVDKSIEKTDEVIEETKELKKGLMQDLLTKGIGYSEFKQVRIGPRDVEIPFDWEVKKINDIAKVKGGKRVPKNLTLVEEETSYPYIRVSDFDNLSVDTDNLKYATEEIFNKISQYTISKDDVYISIAGTIGLVGVVPDELDNQLLTENAAKIMINEKEEVDNKFLAYSLSGFEPQSQIQAFIGTTGVPKLSLGRTKKIIIPLPPLSEQKKIASILSSVDSKIKKEEEYKSKLEELKKGLMQKLLTGEIRVNTEMEV